VLRKTPAAGHRLFKELSLGFDKYFFVKLTSIKLSSTNATLVCVLSDIKYAVIFCICPVTDISAEVPPFGVKVCVTIDLSSGQKVSPIGDDIFRGHQMGDRKGRGGQCLGL